MQLELIFSIVILIFSVVIHEVSHGYAAEMLGDPTARLSGRLTLNPLNHLDPLGSVIIPLFLVLSHSGFLIGWAKPVPYNPYNLRDGRWGEAIVAAAGPLVNIFVALIFGLVVRVGVHFAAFPTSFISIAGYVVLINILLALFNLIPVPPLDGSKVLKALLPFSATYKYEEFMSVFSRYGVLASILFIFLFISFLWQPFSILVLYLVTLITGLPPTF